MLKRISKQQGILVSLALLVVALSLVGYLQLKNEPDHISPFQAISESASAVLGVNDYQRSFDNLTNQNNMWQTLQSDEGVLKVNEDLMRFDSLLKKGVDQSNLSELKVIVAFYATGGNALDPCFLIPISKAGADQKKELLQTICLSISTYGLFEEVEIQEGKLRDEALGSVYWAKVNDLIIFGFLPNLIEDAIRNIHSGANLFVNEEFIAVQKTTGEFADWNLFLNYHQKACLRFLGINDKSILESDLIWSGWTALDATLHPNLLLLNGFSNAGSTTFLSQFDKQKSQDIDVVEILPWNVSLFFHFGVSNYGKYLESKRKYFKSTGKTEAYEKKLDWLQQQHHFEIESDLKNWVANEFGIVYLNHPGIEDIDAKVAYFRLSDLRKAKAALDRLNDEGKSNSDQLDENQLDIENLFDDVEGPLFNGLDRPYYAIVDKYLLFSKHRVLIEDVKNHYKLARTLKKSESYAGLSSNLSDQSNVYLYINMSEGFKIYQQMLHQGSNEFLIENPDFVKKFEHLGMQFTDGKKNLFYQHTALSYNEKKRSEGHMLWEAALDTALAMKPKIVYNHYSNAREIFVQDVANKIYLIDNRGNVIWKRQLKEPIVSDVFQIDVYKNNKLQILFSGESSIYLIDRKGRDVENYPVQLPAVSTNGLAVLDYEKNREYRILISVRGGKVLNYDRFGLPINGWSFESEEEIPLPVKHFILNGKDYIVCVGAGGTPYLLNRKGEVRAKIKENLPSDIKDYQLELSNEFSQCKFVTSDNSGNVIKLQFNGEKEIINFDQFGSGYHFIYGDLNNDQKSDYVFLDSNKLMAYDHRKEKIFEIELERPINEAPFLYSFSDGYGKIGMTDGPEDKIYLYKDAGSLDENFPLKGNTEFTITDLNKDGRFNLIVGLNNKLLVYNLE